MRGGQEPAREVIVVRDGIALARAAAARFAAAAEAAVATRGCFAVALAGGATPRALYALLAREPYRSRLPWRRTRVFWGDERCVPPTHPASNYRMGSETLLRHVPIPPAQVHRMRGEAPDPRRAAADYVRTLQRAFRPRGGRPPRFDLILLGLGADGHTASLFPGSSELRERRRWAIAAEGPGGQGGRLTLTLPVLNAAARILFLVSGRQKARVFRAILAAPGGGDDLPAARVRPAGGTIAWLADREAAALLRRQPPRRGS